MRYEAKLLLSTLSALLIVAATIYTADPYGIFNARIDDEPLDREFFQANVRLAKANIVSRFPPEAVILGTSRAEVGISPAHPAWEYQLVYNLGLPQSNVRENREYLEHAIAAGSLKQAVYGLDFFQFNPMLEPRPDFSECRLRNPGSQWTRIRAVICDIPALFLSRSAFIHSTAQFRPRAKASVYLRDGSRSDAAKEAELRSAGSQHAAFLRSEFAFFSDVELLRGFLESDAGFEETIGPEFEALLRMSYRNGIDLRFYVSPAHARNGELLGEMGLLDEFVRWKRYLLSTTNRIAREFGSEPYPIWDFSDYNVFTMEPLPPLEDADSRMQWHWESSHFTRALGERVLDQVLGGEAAGPGRKLEIDDFDVWTGGIASRRVGYRRATQGELQLMHDYLVSPVKRKEIDRLFRHQN